MWKVGPRWQPRKTPKLPAPMDTPNIHLYTEQFLLKNNGWLSEQLLLNKREKDHLRKDRRDGEVVTKETLPQWVTCSREG